MKSSELRFLVDVGVGKGIEKYLREDGYDTKTVRDIDPRMETPPEYLRQDVQDGQD